MVKFRAGHRVRLQSGGPWMTVAQIRDDGVVQTEWFRDRLVIRDAFDPEQLMLHWADWLLDWAAPPMASQRA